MGDFCLLFVDGNITFMGTDIVETRKVGSLFYRIVSVDDKFTIYVSDAKKTEAQLSESDFSAIASFSNITDARKHIESIPVD